MFKEGPAQTSPIGTLVHPQRFSLMDCDFFRILSVLTSDGDNLFTCILNCVVSMSIFKISKNNPTSFNLILNSSFQHGAGCRRAVQCWKNVYNLHTSYRITN